MSKFPTTKFHPEPVEPGKVAQAIKDTGAQVVTKGEAGAIVMLPVDEINVFPDLQARVQGKAWNERVDALAADMASLGYLATKPLDVFAVREAGEDGKPVDIIYVADGHTRFAAVQKAIANGAKIGTVPVIFRPAGTTIEQITADTIRNNAGEPFSPYEQSVVVARLKGFGRSEDEIAATLGKTKRYVQDLLVLSEAPPAIRNAVLKGEVAASVAVREIRAAGAEKAAESIGKAVEKAKASGKTKATKSVVKGKTKQTGKKKADAPAKGEKASTPAQEPTPAPAPTKAKPGAPDDAAFLKAALTYAVEHGKAADGIRWAKSFLAGDKAAAAELEKWMGQPEGSYFDATLRVAEDDLNDL